MVGVVNVRHPILGVTNGDDKMPIQRCQLSSDLAIRCQIGQTKDGRYLSVDRCPKAGIDAAAPVDTVAAQRSDSTHRESVIRHVVTLELAQERVVTLELAQELMYMNSHAVACVHAGTWRRC